MGIDSKSWCRRKCHKGWPSGGSTPGGNGLSLRVLGDTYALGAAPTANLSQNPVKEYHIFLKLENNPGNNDTVINVRQTADPFQSPFWLKYSTNGPRWILQYEDDTHNGGAWWTSSTAAPLTLNVWYHFIFIMTAVPLIEFWYCDLTGGGKVFPGDYTLHDSTAPAGGGGVTAFSEWQWTGPVVSTRVGIGDAVTGSNGPYRISDIRTFDTLRSNAERTLYNSQRYAAAPAGGETYFRMDEVTGSANAIEQWQGAGLVLPYTQGAGGLVGYADAPPGF